MTTETAAPRTFRQPAPGRIDSPDQALRTYLLDPSLDNPTSAYAAGWLVGSLAGVRCAAEVMTSQDHRDHDTAYLTHLRPQPLVAALEQHLSASVIWTVGWLSGWRYGTEGAPDRRECSSCGRALFLDMDSVHHCLRDLEWLCAGESMSCWQGVCPESAEHAACHDEPELSAVGD